MIDFLNKFSIYQKLDKKFNISKYVPMLSYLFFGVVTTIINIASYALFTKVFKIDYMVSSVISWILAVTVAYITNKLFVFENNAKSKQGIFKEVIRFFLVRVFSLVLELIIMYIGVSLIHIDDMIMKIVTQVIVIVTNYFMSKYVVFTKK